VPFKSADGGRLNDEAFLRLLAHGSAPLQSKGKSQRPGGAALADLPLVANDVVKVSRTRCKAWVSAGRPASGSMDGMRLVILPPIANDEVVRVTTLLQHMPLCWCWV